MKKEKKKMSNQKFTAIWSAVLALLVIVTVVVNIVLTGPLYTVMNMYFGKGEAKIKVAEGSENWDSEYYKSDYSSNEELQQAGAELATQIEGEGLVMLKNDNQTLPLTAGGNAITDSNKANVSLFGRTSVDPIYSGAGSAEVGDNCKDYQTAFEANNLQVNNTLYDFYEKHPKSTENHKVTIETTFMGNVDGEYKGRGFISTMGVATFTGDVIAEVPSEDITEAVETSYTSYNDAAIVVIGRVGGEGCDLPTRMGEFATYSQDENKHYLELNTDEQNLLKYVKAQKDAGVFSKVVVILNTVNAMELGFLNDAAYGIDAALWVGSLGDDGSTAVAQAINGQITPSGRLVDTYVYDLTQDPSYVNFAPSRYNNVDGSIDGQDTGTFVQYEEGIYVGYRFYETAAAEAQAGNYEGFEYDKMVQYPFGYGMSYTDFTMEYAQAPTYQDGVFTFNVKVTNTGDTYSGKQVVQIYAETPYTAGGIEKSKVVLAAFAKTDILAPGASQNVTLTINQEDLASYDYKDAKAYVLDEGMYQFYLSDNSHSWNEITTDDAGRYFAQDVNAVVYNEDNGRSSDEVTATNHFDEASAMFTDTVTEGFATNMSRSDFAGTYPTAPTDADMIATDDIKTALETAFDETTDSVLGNVEGSLVYTEEASVQGVDNGLKLINLRGLDYNDSAWESLLDQLNMSDMANLLANAGFNTAELTAIAKPATLDYDGPLGWSTWVTASGANAVVEAFPAEEVLAATFNIDLAYAMGDIIGEQGLVDGFNGWYAPAMNTHRNAFAGRNYEYYSEDGFLAGMMAAQEVAGAADKGTYCYLKHFAINDKEDARRAIATWVNEQAIREIYLRPFELCIKNAMTEINYIADEDGNWATREIKATTAIMSSYNRIGTTWAGGSYDLLTNVLRNEWGFDGFVLSDYYGGDVYMDPDEGIRAGNDAMLNTFADGSLTDTTSTTGVKMVRNAIHNVLYTVANSAAMQHVVPGATITYALAGWQIAMIAGDVVAGVLALIIIYMIINRRKKATITID